VGQIGRFSEEVRREMTSSSAHLSPAKISSIFRVAWAARDHARIIGLTAVGAAVLSEEGNVWVGANVEHRFRSHDIHAEVNAIGTMVAAGDQVIRAVVVVANRERFTPCGSCMDWIFEFASPDCEIYFQSAIGASWSRFTPEQLMPHYPR
jgi:cytidine deaminase